MVDVKRHRNADDMTDVFYTDGTVDYGRVQGNNPLAGGEYPKALYRAGGRESVHGHMVDMLTVHDDAEEEVYAKEGWRTTPAKAAALGEVLLAEEAAKPDPRDDVIAELRRQLAEADEKPKLGDKFFEEADTYVGEQMVKQGKPRGRPRKADQVEESDI